MLHISPKLAFALELFAKPKVSTFSQGVQPSFTTASADALAPVPHKSRVRLGAGAFRLCAFGSCRVSQIPHGTNQVLRSFEYFLQAITWANAGILR